MLLSSSARTKSLTVPVSNRNGANTLSLNCFQLLSSPRAKYAFCKLLV